MKKFFRRFMLVLVLAEIAVLAHAWTLSYVRAYTYEAIHTNETCGCSDSYLIIDSDTDASYTWEFAGKQASPILVVGGGSGDPASDCWHSRAVSAAWDNTFIPFTRFAGIDILIAATAFIVWTYSDKREDTLDE